jgi:hypothetical protein
MKDHLYYNSIETRGQFYISKYLVSFKKCCKNYS